MQRGQLASNDGGKQRDVAVKVVRVPDSVQTKDVGALDQVVATTYLASHSPHVCKMHGVSWTEKDTWYASLRIDVHDVLQVRDTPVGFSASTPCFYFVEWHAS